MEKMLKAHGPHACNPGGAMYIVIHVNSTPWSCEVHWLCSFMQLLVQTILIHCSLHTYYVPSMEQVSGAMQVARRWPVLLQLLGERLVTHCSKEKSA